VPLHSRFEHEHGQTMAEYALVLGLITLAIVTAIALLSGGIENSLNAVTDLLP
jgi:Flp pilus assembly pilin Flp